MIERGQADGSFRDDVDARLASWIFAGIEEILTGWVLGSCRTATRRWRVPSEPLSPSSAAVSYGTAQRHPSRRYTACVWTLGSARSASPSR